MARKSSPAAPRTVATPSAHAGPRLPGAYDRLIERPRLGDLEERIPWTRLVLVRAPAGYGKTSLLLQWLERVSARIPRVAWLTIDAADDDPAHLLGRLAAALLPSGSTRAKPRARERASVLDALAASEPFVLFLDELEHLRSDGSNRIVERLIELLPEGSSVVVATREAPRFPLGTLRVRGALLEIALEDLRFTEEEARSMLRSRALDVDEATASDVLARTEGWAAGLQLAALAIGARTDAAAFLRSLSGSRREVAEFLAEQVFARQTEDVRRFLLRTSILDRLSPPLCDVVTGESGSAARIEELERGGLFLLATDAERLWWRYHPLFAEFLRDRLRRERAEEIVRLHRAAAGWHAVHGKPVDAVRHAFDAEDLALAAGLVERFARPTLLQGHHATVVGWTERLPSKVLDAHPAIRESAGFAYACLRRFGEARREVEALRRLTETDAVSPTTRDAILALGPVLLVFEDRGPEALAAARESVPRLSGEDPFSVAGVLHALGLGLVATGEYEEARSALVAARANNERIGSIFAAVYSIALLGLCEASQGKLRAARAIYEEARERSERGEPPSPYVTMIVSAYLAELLYEQGELDAAEELLLPAFPPLAESAIGDMLASAFLTRARLRIARDDGEGARRVLEEAETYGFRTGFWRLVGMARWERVRIALQEGALDEARGYRRHSGDESWEAEPRGFFHHASETEARDLGDLRFQIRTGDAAAALPRLRALLTQAEHGRRGWRALRLRILEAEALDAAGDRSGALRSLHEALKRAATEGFVRSFVDEGAALLSLVRVFHDRTRTSEEAAADAGARAHAARILAHAGVPVDAPALADAPELDAPLEPLSEREREILTLVSEGLSNRVLAERLFVSEHTVKWHLLKIFQKLRVHSRSRAVAVARHQQLIP